MTDEPDDREVVSRAATKALSCFRYFVCDVMHFDGTRKPVGDEDEPDFTDPAYDSLFDSLEELDAEDGPDTAIIQATRGTGKSTLVSRLRPMYRGLQNPNRRILLSHAKHGVACGWVNTIHGWMSEGNYDPENGRFSELRNIIGPTGRLPPIGEKWGKEGWLIFPKRTVVHDEPTIMATGTDNIVTGLHFEEVDADDYINQQNYRSEGVLLKAEETWKLTTALMVGKKKRRTLVGTRWNAKDLIGNEIAAEKERVKKGEPRSRSIVFLPGRKADGTPRFRHLNDAALQKMLRNMGPSLYAGQVDLMPVTDGLSPLKEEYFKPHFFKLSEVGTEVENRRGDVIGFKAHPEFHVAIFVDLAGSQKEEADRTAIIVRASDPRGHIYVLEALAGRWMPGNEVLMHLSRLRRFYRADYIGCEKGPYRAIYEGYIRNWNAAHRGAPMVFNSDIKTGGGKNRRIGSDRIYSLEPWAQAGQIHLLESQTELLYELCVYPNGGHDDLADAMALAVLNPWRARVPGGKKEEEKRSEVDRIMDDFLGRQKRQEAEAWMDY